MNTRTNPSAFPLIPYRQISLLQAGCNKEIAQISRAGYKE